jgi:hypothetical protein
MLTQFDVDLVIAVNHDAIAESEEREYYDQPIEYDPRCILHHHAAMIVVFVVT